MIRILVIEPEAPSRHALRNILEGAGYEVELAVDGANGAKAHSVRPADLVIADLADVAPDLAFPGSRLLSLPGGLARRDAPALDHGRTVAYTLPKPFRRDDLLAAIRVTLGLAPPVPA